MRARLLVDLATSCRARRQRDAMAVLQLALRLFLTGATRLVVLISMGIVQLRRQSPESAQALFETVLGEGEQGGWASNTRQPVITNLGLACSARAKKPRLCASSTKAIETFPPPSTAGAAQAWHKAARQAGSRCSG